ncbi:MAG: hypothetical protein RKR03_17240 [Candidatus Competibacter sp.]|nr:hypothetical protein [Candidatus Competibacter sp.]
MNALAELLPWRVRLTGRRLVTASFYSKYYDMSAKYLQEIGIYEPSSHLTERAIKGVGLSIFNARCIEARTVPGTWEQVIRLLPKAGIESVADIGCGNENPGRIIEKLGLKVAYSDIEPFTHIPNFRQMNFNEGIGYNRVVHQ